MATIFPKIKRDKKTTFLPTAGRRRFTLISSVRGSDVFEFRVKLLILTEQDLDPDALTPPSLTLVLSPSGRNLLDKVGFFSLGGFYLLMLLMLLR